MNNSPLVSIIINCFNGEKYLKEAINSVCLQSYSNWEIIFWDNLSTDNSASIAKSFDDVRIQYHCSAEFTPLGFARNQAVSKAKGLWVAFLDSDDVWHKDKLYDSLLALSEHKEKDKVSLIYTKTTRIDDLGHRIGESIRFDSGNLLDPLLRHGNFIVQSSIMVKKETFNLVGGFNPEFTYCPDYDLLLKITRINLAIGINKFLTFYRVHDGSITSTKTYDNSIEAIDFMINYLKKNNLSFITRVILGKNITYKVTVFFTKLIFKKEFKQVFIVVKSYYKYLLFGPLVVPNIIINIIKK
jgi:glycosyltransferase involved in cell wall biosynthesis